MQVYRLTKEQLLKDLYQAYFDARKHKRNKPYQLRFEANLENNLQELCNELFDRTYKARPSICFIISDPKKREVFAANFRDRIVHHLYYNYTHEIYERTFIHDTYSCIKGRGTHYGIDRLQQHIRKESQNYKIPCYALKMDIRGYFMHINREKLLQICFATLEKMACHKASKYLTREIVLLNPLENCIIEGGIEDWRDLPHDKSLFNSPVGCGLPIGNLTSQLFSNIYLNILDQYVKRELKAKHYGRYVDDFYIVSSDKTRLLEYANKIKTMLMHELNLMFHDGKMRIVSIRQGIEFLGAFIKPYRIYASRQTINRIRKKLPLLRNQPLIKIVSSLNSYCGVLSHGENYKLRKNLFLEEVESSMDIRFNSSYLKCV